MVKVGGASADSPWYAGFSSTMARSNIMMCPASTGKGCPVIRVCSSNQYGRSVRQKRVARGLVRVEVRRKSLELGLPLLHETRHALAEVGRAREELHRS